MNGFWQVSKSVKSYNAKASLNKKYLFTVLNSLKLELKYNSL